MLIINYSLLKLFTGLVIAAFIAWKLTVRSAIRIAANPAARNIHQLIATRYSKLCNQLCIIHQATGNATRQEIRTKIKKSFESNFAIPATLAPNTFLIPISLVLLSDV